jgi:hypothetical protein
VGGQYCNRLRADHDSSLVARLGLLSLRPDRGWALLRCRVSRAPARSTWRQGSALTSPRREPVTIVSQSSRPQSGSLAHASSSSRAASSAVGGSGSVATGAAPGPVEPYSP